MSFRYPAGLITANSPVNANYPSGVWTPQQAYPYIANNVWGDDPYFNQTVLLLHGDGTNGAQNNTFLDSSTNNFTITRNGDTTQGTFSPFSVGAGEWSNYFDGTGDYLTVPNNTALDLQSGDFTVECWFYLTGGSGTLRPIISRFNGNAATRSDLQFFIRVSSANNLQITPYSGTTVYDMEFTGPIALNTWHHCALVRTGNTFYAYFNGVRNATTQTITGNLNNGTWETWIGGYREGGTFYYTPGYIASARILKGTALYTGSTYTIPTAPPTAITNTSLLTCQSNRFVDNSTNNFTITRNGDVRVTPFSPFQPTQAYSPAVTGGSGYFDDTGDYLTIPSSAAYRIESNTTWTWECWVYPVTLAATDVLSGNTTNGASTGHVFYLASGLLRLIQYGNANFASTATVRVNEWNHLAAVSNANSITFYLNGAAAGTATWGAGSAGGTMYIGAGYTGGDLFNGYMAGLRYVVGSTVTPASGGPTSPPTNVTNTALLLNFTNAGILDNTNKNVLETEGNAQIDTSIVKYGTGSMEFDGTGDYLVIPNDPNFNFGSGDFTIEAWVNTSAYSASYNVIASRWTSGTTKSWLWYITSTGLTFFYSTDGSNQSSVSASATLSTGVWRHLVVTRASGSVKFFVDGSQVGTTQTVSSAFYTAATSSHVGILGDLNATTAMNGYIDDLRITKGIARYTANFIPPIARMPNQ
jgi:hypothetical protein